MSKTHHRRPRKKKRRRRDAPLVRTGSALYQCKGCGHRWYQDPGMVECPMCKDFHVAWLNYDELEKAGAFGDREEY